MAIVLADTFAGETAGTNLTAHAATTGGGSYAKHPNFGGDVFISTAGRSYAVTSAGQVATYFHSKDDLPAELDVTVDFVVVGGPATSMGIVARCDITASTYYLARYNGAGYWEIFKTVAGSATNLGTYTQALTVGQTYVMRFAVRDATKKLFVDGVERISTTDNAIAGTTSTSNRVGIRNGSDAADTTGTHLDNLSVDNLAAADAVTLTQVTNHRIFQRSGAAANLSLAGTYTGTAPATIEIQVVKQSDSSVVQAWTGISSPSITGGNWSGTLSVPAGPDMLRLDVRSRSAVPATLATVAGTTQFGVGDVFLLAGSSTLANWVVSGGTPTFTSVARQRTSGGTWQTITGNGVGAAGFTNAYGPLSGVVVGFLAQAVGGDWLQAAHPGWASNAFGSYTAAVAAVAAAGGIAGAILAMGSNDAAGAAVASQAAHEAEWRALFANLRADTGITNLPCFLLGSNRRTVLADPYFDRIRAAELVVGGDANVYNAANSMEFALLGDGTHLTDYGPQAARVGNCAGAILAGSGTWPGPRITAAAFTSPARTTIDVTVTHGDGSDISPASGITGFSLVDGGTPPTITAATRQNATTIRLALSAAPTGATTVQYQSGTNPTVSAPVFDTTALALPVSPAIGSLALPVAEPTQTLSPPLLTNASTIFAPTVTRGPVAIAPPLVSNASTIFAPTVTRGPVTIAPPLVSNASTVLAPTVTRGPVTIAPPLVSNASTVLAPTVTLDLTQYLHCGVPLLDVDGNPLLTVDGDAILAVGPTVDNQSTILAANVTGRNTVAPPLVAGGSTVFAPVVSQGGVTIVPPVVVNASGPLVPSITTGPVTIAPPLVAGGSTVFAPVVSQGGVIIAPPLLVNPSGVLAPSITTGSVAIAPPLVAGGSTVLVPTVTSRVTISTPVVMNGSTVFPPSVTIGAATLSPPLVTSGSTVFPPTVTQEMATIAPPLVDSGSMVFAPTLTRAGGPPRGRRRARIHPVRLIQSIH